MKVHVLKRIQIAKGNKIITFQPNEEPDIPDDVAKEYLRNGAVERYETKVIRQDPLPDAGAASLSSASPAGQALPLTTSKKSSTGGGKKKAAQ